MEAQRRKKFKEGHLTVSNAAEMWKIVKTEELLSDSAIQRSLLPLSGADSEGGG